MLLLVIVIVLIAFLFVLCYTIFRLTCFGFFFFRAESFLNGA